MKEQPKMGVNRTGAQMSPFDSTEMKSGIDAMMPPAPGDMSAMAAMRSSYIVESDTVGSVPVPGSVKGMLQTGMSALTGNTPQLLIDKLGERLAFERTGTRLYDALITKVAAVEEEGIGTISGERLMQIRNDEAMHVGLVADAIVRLGADPTCMTPCADLVGVESLGLMQVLTDPRTTVAQSLHAILVAEMTDNNGWETLIALAEAQGHDDIANDFRTALANERDHLQQIQRWFDEAILGDSLPASGASGTAGGDASPSIH
ncbi:ferritin-like domain-containing protein [Noviherbaspirillum sp. CPCC 100848]|uniref:Ferritin-like domain-containing protein n=1 Tax=Noviherbaspirillum album TaxID=3080276 RepID=A0ABU6J9J3_9BURK|nr:ferritin-like domain-containing protein [Noviherbaspirillum sp. CPCC 100848]MEC4719952.1 ferritin-like domain-containing protein [Noviherbaspirillum sp. CPCC 100848]